MMVVHKLNTLHWHLTEDQGWRIEIKRYPKLTEFGSKRKGTMIEKQWGSCDNVPYGGYYTQDEIREVVAYAAARGITVVPEIDLPGHMLAALACYPELGCTGGPYEAETGGGVLEDVLCPGKEKTFEFLENVLTEVMELFPSEYIHIGGDECPKTRWEKCPACQARIKALGLKDDDRHSAEHYLQSYVTARIEKFLNEHGRRIIGWDEILEGELAPNATVMSWRGEEGGRTAAAAGHEVGMTPGGYCYFDGYQDDPTTEPQAMSGFLPLEKVYSYDPAPADMPGREYVLGVQANLWTEYIPTAEQAEYMLYPRLFALAEVAWCQPEGKDYGAFRERALRYTELARSRGYNTFDLAGETGERPESLEPAEHLAVGCPVTYATRWNGGYPAAGERALTAGLRGSWSYKERWQGFLGCDVDVTVDLGEVKPISEVSADFTQWYSAWIWLPARVEIEVSDDGNDFRRIAVVENDYLETAERPEYRTFGWTGSEQARYVRYHAILNERVGGWLFTDEIIIN